MFCEETGKTLTNVPAPFFRSVLAMPVMVSVMHSTTQPVLQFVHYKTRPRCCVVLCWSGVHG